MKLHFLAFLALALAQASHARACGYCVEDKVASTYDHAVVTRALAQKHRVVFFHVEGAVAQGEAAKRWLEAAAASTAGVDPGSARAAADTLTLSIAFDPQRSSLVAVQSALEKKLAARKLTLLPLRVLDKPSDLALMRKERISP